MNKVLLSVIIGAAVAATIYYFYDREGAEELFGDVKNAASDAFSQISDHLTQVGKDAISDAMRTA